MCHNKKICAKKKIIAFSLCCKFFAQISAVFTAYSDLYTVTYKKSIAGKIPTGVIL